MLSCKSFKKSILGVPGWLSQLSVCLLGWSTVSGSLFSWKPASPSPPHLCSLLLSLLLSLSLSNKQNLKKKKIHSDFQIVVLLLWRLPFSNSGYFIILLEYFSFALKNNFWAVWVAQWLNICF